MEHNADMEDLNLIKEILENIVNKEVVKKNFEELGQRYGKAADTLIKITFKSDFKNELEILNELKRTK